MNAAPPFDCAQCGRRIGKTRPHFILTNRTVVCVRHHTEHYDNGRIAHGFCSRAAAARLLGLWP
jgi:hypothetical protein